MFNLEFSYLLQSIPRSIATNYLNESFRFQLPTSANDPVYFFFADRSQKLPHSFSEAVKLFPNSCFLIQQASRFCLVIVAEIREFNRIMSWSAEQECSELQQALDKELNYLPSGRFKIRNLSWDYGTPRIMGILNITPDSFYDGGKYFKQQDYSEIAAQFITNGADIIDIGGESSRPGSFPVSVQEEIQRVLPAVKQIRQKYEIPISVDTVKPEVAEAVLSAGADMINDTSGLAAGDKMIRVLKTFRASYCLMHIQGIPQQMQQNPQYVDIISEIYGFFQSNLNLLAKGGVTLDRICIDPGIGFGKLFTHNINLLRFLSVFTNLQQVILLGTSNKSFIGQALAKDVEHRLAGTLATHIMGWLKGATIFRVHDVEAAKDSLEIARLYSQGQTVRS